MQLYRIQIGDNWHGPGAEKIFFPKEQCYTEILDLVTNYCQAYGGKPHDWPLLETFEDGKVVHSRNGWLNFSVVNVDGE